METPSYFRYWGKTASNNTPEHPEAIPSGLQQYHLLVYHLLDVAAVAWTILDEDAALRKRLASLCGLNDRLFQVWFTFLAGLHDVGKFSQRFQSLQPEIVLELNATLTSQPYILKHDSMSYIAFQDILRPYFEKSSSTFFIQTQDLFNNEYIYVLFSAFAWHHGAPGNSDQYGDKSLYFDDYSQNNIILFSEHFIQLLNGMLSDDDWLVCDCEAIPPKATWLLNGLTVLCDWLGSNSSYFTFKDIEELVPLSEYWNTALIIAKKITIDNAIIPSHISSELTLDVFFPNIEKPTDLQAWTQKVELSVVPSITIIEDIPGSGKTEASIFLAHRMMSKGLAEGIYSSLPSMATSNQFFERFIGEYRKLFTKGSYPSLVLTHGSSEIQMEYFRENLSKQKSNEKNYTNDETNISFDCNSWFSEKGKKAFLAEVGVGTIDQMLLSILPSKHQSLRLLGLFRKILIVDEVHSNDAYVHQLLRSVLTFQAALGGSVIILSATLTSKMKRELLSSFAKGLDTSIPKSYIPSDLYPLATYYNGSKIQETINDNSNSQFLKLKAREDLKRTTEVVHISSVDEIYNLIISAVNNNKCVCWIRNTVEDALDAYDILHGKGFKPMLFHSRFALEDRKEIEKNVVATFGKKSTARTRKQKILIATQVVEQSLDVDFDILFTDIAPIDSIIQRAGRLHRHSRSKDGNLLPYGENDQREKGIMYVLCPSVEEPITRNWIAQTSKGTGSVYQDHKVLWRTAEQLCIRKKISMPEDARRLIEYVFDDNNYAPDTLQHSEDNSKAESISKRHIAQDNSLSINLGYCIQNNAWRDEKITPTRLGTESITLRFLCYNNGILTPYSNQEKYVWHLSEAKIPYTYFKSYPTKDNYIENNIFDIISSYIAEKMPDKCRFSVAAVLVCISPVCWYGRAIHIDKEIRFYYSSSQGIKIIQ